MKTLKTLLMLYGFFALLNNAGLVDKATDMLAQKEAPQAFMYAGLEHPNPKVSPEVSEDQTSFIV